MALSINLATVGNALVKVYLAEAEKNLPLPMLAAAMDGGDSKGAVANLALWMLSADIARVLAADQLAVKRSYLEDIAAKLPPEALAPEEDGIPF